MSGGIDHQQKNTVSFGISFASCLPAESEPATRKTRLVERFAARAKAFAFRKAVPFSQKSRSRISGDAEAETVAAFAFLNDATECGWTRNRAEYAATSTDTAEEVSHLVVFPTPLPDIPCHVVEAQFIRGLGANGVDGAARIARMPCDGIQIIAAGVGIAFAFDSASGRPFPFHLGRETVAVRAGVDRRHASAGAVGRTIQFVNRREALLFALRIAPFHSFKPSHECNGFLIARSPAGPGQIISFRDSPIRDLFPLEVGDLEFPDLQCRDFLSRHLRGFRQCPALHRDHFGGERKGKQQGKNGDAEAVKEFCFHRLVHVRGLFCGQGSQRCFAEGGGDV